MVLKLLGDYEQNRLKLLEEHLSLVPPAALLTHYTTLQGLLSITRSKTLWASHCQYLNDGLEIEHGLSLIREVAARRAETAKDPAVLIMYQTNARRSIHDGDSNIYTASFTEVHDDLSQWRGYSKGGGAVLSFDQRLLSAIADASGFIVAKCVYDDCLKVAMIEEYFDIIEGQIDGTNTAPGMIHTNVWFASMNLWWMAALFKAKAFEAEQEWRLISRGNTQTSLVRSTDTMLIPYKELKLDLFDNGGIGVDYVTIGPGQNQELILAAYRMAKQGANVWMPHLDQISEIPYRQL